MESQGVFREKSRKNRKKIRVCGQLCAPPQHIVKKAPPEGVPVFLLAAAAAVVAAATVAAAAVVAAPQAAVIAAAAEQDQQDDDPAHIPTAETIVTHKITSANFVAVFAAHSKIFHRPKKVQPRNNACCKFLFSGTSCRGRLRPSAQNAWYSNDGWVASGG